MKKSNKPIKTKKAMKKTIKFLSMAALVLVGAMMIGCTNDDDNIEQQPENKSNVTTLKTTICFDEGATTRALGIDYENKQAVKTFAAGETMAIVYKNKSSNTVKAVSSALETTDIEDGSKSATFTFELTDPDKGEDVTYIYPAAMAGDDDVNFDALATQDGTQASLSSTLDLATYSGAWNGDNLPAGTLHNELAVLALTLKNGAGTKDITSTITGLTVSDGTNTYTVSRSASAGPIYLAIRPTSGADIEVTATDGSKNYTKTLTSKTYAANNFYPIGWKLLTLIEWSQSELEGIGSLYSGGVGSRSLKGVTLTKPSTESTFYTYDVGKYFGGEFQFSTVLGKFTKIAVTATGTVNGSGWSGNVWTGTAANIVNIAESDFNATNIVFTIEEDIVDVSGITLNKTSTSIEAGQTETLTATVLPAEADDKSVTWTTSNSGVATVSGGVVTAVAAGTATITASAGGYSATCEVTVTAAPEPEPEPSGDLTSFDIEGVTVYYVPGETWEQAEDHPQNEWFIDEGAVCPGNGTVLYWLEDGWNDLQVSSDEKIDPNKEYFWY